MGKYTRVAIYVCAGCNQEIEPPMQGDITTGYGIDRDGNKYCYACCAAQDRQYMIDNGRITLYLSKETNPNYTGLGTMDSRYPDLYYVTNWPNSLSFPVRGYPHKGKHNIARNRYDVWFVGPDKHIWHGVRYGDMTDICHCKRTKQVIAAPGAQ